MAVAPNSALKQGRRSESADGRLLALGIEPESSLNEDMDSVARAGMVPAVPWDETGQPFESHLVGHAPRRQ